MREIIFYRTESGLCPIEKFLNALSPKNAQKVTWVLLLTEELEFVPVKYFKKMSETDGLWEIRVKCGSNIFRLFGFMGNNNTIILNHAFQKKMQKTPKKEIQIAEARKKDFLNRGKKK